LEVIELSGSLSTQVGVQSVSIGFELIGNIVLRRIISYFLVNAVFLGRMRGLGQHARGVHLGCVTLAVELETTSAVGLLRSLLVDCALLGRNDTGVYLREGYGIVWSVCI